MSLHLEVVESMKKLNDNTIEVKFKDNAVITLDHIKETYKVLHEMSGSVPHKKLIVTGKQTEITKDARIFGMEEAKRIGDYVLAEAVLVHSLYQKMVINFYRRFIDSKYPTRFFTDVDKAKEWLEKF